MAAVIERVGRPEEALRDFITNVGIEFNKRWRLCQNAIQSCQRKVRMRFENLASRQRAARGLVMRRGARD